MKNKKEENQMSLKEVKKGKFKANFIKKIKSKLLINRTSTLLVIAILIAVFILINSIVAYFDFTPIDCTTSQDYTLTDESKERVNNIEQEVNIYFVGWSDTDKDYILAKQYNKANSNINVEIIDVTENLEIANKYDVTSDDKVIIIESGEASRTLSYYDIVTYDSNYNEVDIAEQKITSAILNVTSGVIPKVYFLTGYTSFSLSNVNGGLNLFSQYLEDEVLTYEELNILNTQKVPDDCDTLIIMTPEKDFDKMVADKIIEYIKTGGNILWLNGAYPQKMELTNVDRVLAEYGINSFDSGYIYETSSANTILGYPFCLIPEVQYTDITKDVYQGAGAILLYPTKININSDKLEELNVEKTDLVLTGDTTYFTTDITGQGITSSNSEKGSFVVGAQMIKTISENTNSEDEADNSVKSRLIIYGNDYFITDQSLQDSSGNSYYMIYLSNNADLGLNSIAYLTNQDQDITIRKSYSDSVTSFTPTDKEKSVIMAIVFIVPIAVIFLGIVVWIIRRRRI